MDFPFGVWLLCWTIASHQGAVFSISCPHHMVGLENCECSSFENAKTPVRHIDEVVCRNLGHTSHQALESLRLVPHIQRLEYTGNDIRELAANIFGNCSQIHLVNLTYVDLSHNNIEIIHGQSFHCAPNVRILKLNYNKWRVDGSHARIFSSMPHLQELHLRAAFAGTGTPAGGSTIGLRSVLQGSHIVALRKLHLEENDLQFVDGQTFCQLPNLEELYLSDNRLTKLSLDCLDQLRDLYVRNNSIPWLTEEDIRSLERKKYLSVLDLRNNQFQCTDCSARTSHFRDWLLTGSRFVVDKSRLTCTKGRLAGRKITSLTDDDLRGTCPKPHHDQKSRSRTKSIITAVILSVIGLLVVVFIYINRHGIQKTLSKWGKPIRNSAIMKRVHFGYRNMNSENSAPTMATL
ncbi:hypothetical protein LSH36_133g04000 [Paralvinella palmiformis]|uniref:Uncharacterized protein n=1 Tax=Paralvinella palmiformis TaxID=53620 RepID=A0AAD9N7X3_9ANNE|nr:hypothetical protein LSH36_133g04000 [Paralvinella palmiformis]